MARAIVLALALLAAAAGGVLALRRPAAAPARDPDVLLDVAVTPCSDGNDLVFRLDRPGRVEVIVVGPEHAPAHVVLGPPGPVQERTGTWRPDPAQAFEIVARGRARIERDLLAVGAYAVRVDPVPAAMETVKDVVRVRVRRLPAAPAPTPSAP